MASILQAYTSATTGTGGITSLASSSSLLSGYAWFVIDNSSALNLDYGVYGKVTVNGSTNVTANTSILLYLFASYDGTTWPNSFSGSAGSFSVTTAGLGAGFLKLAASLQVDAVTQAVGYPFSFNVAQFFGGVCPKKVACVVVQNTGQVLNATGSTHEYGYVGEYATAS